MIDNGLSFPLGVVSLISAEKCVWLLQSKIVLAYWKARRWKEAKLDVIEKQFKVDLEMEKFKFTSSHCVEIGGAATCAEAKKEVIINI